MIDLHALANQPGYGKAKEAIKAAGYWGNPLPFEYRDETTGVTHKGNLTQIRNALKETTT